MSAAGAGLDKFASSFTALMIRLRWLVIIAAIGLAAYMSSGLTHLTYNNNYRAYFSDENPDLQNFLTFQDTFTKSDNLLIVLEPKDGGDIFTNENLAAIGELTEKAWRLPYATRVDSITNFQYSYAIGDELIVEDLVPSPGESAPEKLAKQKANALAEPLLNGLLVSSEADATVVAAFLNFPEKNLTEVPEVVAAARKLRADFVAVHPQFNVYLTGTAMLNNAFGEAIKNDFATLVPILFGIIVIVAIATVRSGSAVAAMLAVVTLSTFTAMGWAGFVRIDFAGPSPFAAIVILTLAIADAMHILITTRRNLRAGLAKREAVIEAMRTNFLPITITSLTTIVGFLALNFADSPPFRDFGNISAVGIFAAWALSITFLPGVLAIIPLRVAESKDAVASSTLTAFANFVIAHYRKLLLLTVGLMAVLISFLPRLELSDENRLYFDRRVEFRRDTDAAIEHFGYVNIEFTLIAGEPGGVSDPDYLWKLDAFAEWLRARPEVVHVYSVADIMKRLNKNMHGDDPAYYRLPDDRELSAQYLLLYELSLPFGLDLTDRINIDKSQTRLTATLKGKTDTKQVRIFLKDVEAWFAANAPDIDGPPTGPQVMFTFIGKRNVESMVTGTTIAIIAISIIMMLTLRSAPIGALSMIPNSLPIIAAYGVWALIDGKIGFSAAGVASLSLGIIVDDTVHFLAKYLRGRREKNLGPEDAVRYAFETVGAAILFNTAILVSGFLVLTLSAFKINQEIGAMTTLSISLALILDFFMLPGLVLATDRGKRAEPRAELT